MMEHRHEQTMWLIGGAGSQVWWCYRCGAIRFVLAESGPTAWQRPVKLGNPWETHADATKAYRKRMATRKRRKATRPKSLNRPWP